MRIAYLVTQYLKINRSFIRRKILALEGRVSEIWRIAICDRNGVHTGMSRALLNSVRQVLPVDEAMLLVDSPQACFWS